MSSRTWTPRAVASEAAPLRFDLWRAVEAQHVVSTMALVDTLDEQHVLERMLDDGKPPVPDGAGALALPAVHAVSLSAAAGRLALSRAERPRRVLWRRRGAHRLRRARLLALAASARRRRRCTAMPAQAADGVSRQARDDAVDLRAAPFVRDRAAWTAPDDYAACQRFGVAAREAGVGAIRYESVRDPQHGGCCAVLTPERVRAPAPLEQQTWMLSVSRERVVWQRTHVLRARRYEFRARGRAEMTPARGSRRRRDPQLGRTDYEPTWRAMQAFTDARDADTPDEIWLTEHPPDLHARARRPARAPAARQRHSGAQGRPRRAGHLSRPRPARRLSCCSTCGARGSASASMVRRIEGAVIEWLDRSGLPHTASRRRPAST